MPDPDPLAHLTEWQRELLDQFFEHRERTGRWSVMVRCGRATFDRALADRLSQQLHSNEPTN